MAIAGCRTEMQKHMLPQIKTTLIWTMDNGTKRDESHRYGGGLAADFLGMALDDIGNRGNLRHESKALNLRNTI